MILWRSVLNVASNELKSMRYSSQVVELFAVVFLQIFLSFHFLLFVCLLFLFLLVCRSVAFHFSIMFTFVSRCTFALCAVCDCFRFTFKLFDALRFGWWRELRGRGVTSCWTEPSYDYLCPSSAIDLLPRVRTAQINLTAAVNRLRRFAVVVVVVVAVVVVVGCCNKWLPH